ncbi:MAG: hypothetical protein IOC52_12610 [Methylobacterium sp.]|jgi:hypothetical protein|nr:hypothetical protein [Methylobacterium sp.]
MSVRHTGSRHDAKGRSTNVALDVRFREMLRPPSDTAWIWITDEMLFSEGFRLLSRSAMQCLFRILIEHAAHAGRQNGQLIVTYDDFADYGVRRSSIALAIRDLENAGFIETLRGKLSYGVGKCPSRYRLTWLPTYEGKAPTNEWRKPANEFAQIQKRARPQTRFRANDPIENGK